MEIRRCGFEGVVKGRKATSEERAEAKSSLVRMGYKVPNSDVPTVVEDDLEDEYLRVLSYIVVERYLLGSYIRETTQTKL